MHQYEDGGERKKRKRKDTEAGGSRVRAREVGRVGQHLAAALSGSVKPYHSATFRWKAGARWSDISGLTIVRGQKSPLHLSFRPRPPEEMMDKRLDIPVESQTELFPSGSSTPSVAPGRCRTGKKVSKRKKAASKDSKKKKGNEKKRKETKKRWTEWKQLKSKRGGTEGGIAGSRP